MKINQHGSSHILLIIVVLIIGIVGFVGYRVLTSDKQTVQNSSTQNQPFTEGVTWQYDEGSGSWKASGDPPDCKQPFTFDQSPVDVSKVTSVLYPGQTRGGDYKAHGGFAFDNNTDTKVAVVMPYDAYLVGGARYLEMGEVQYILDFVSSCGIAIRFDHLAVLSSQLMQLVDSKLPQPKPDNSRGTNFNPPMLVTSGTPVALEVGFKNKLNVGLDFGVYDYRHPNSSSEDASYRSKYGQFSAQTFYGVCWFDMLPGQDAATARALPSRDQKMGKTSDYCK